MKAKRSHKRSGRRLACRRAAASRPAEHSSRIPPPNPLTNSPAPRPSPRVQLRPYQDAVFSTGKLNCSKPLVTKLIESGQLGAINIGTGTVKFYCVPAAEWEKFLRSRAA